MTELLRPKVEALSWALPAGDRVDSMLRARFAYSAPSAEAKS